MTGLMLGDIEAVRLQCTIGKCFDNGLSVKCNVTDVKESCFVCNTSTLCSMLVTFAGWGMCVTFVPDSELSKNPG